MFNSPSYQTAVVQLLQSAIVDFADAPANRDLLVRAACENHIAVGTQNLTPASKKFVRRTFGNLFQSASMTPETARKLALAMDHISRAWFLRPLDPQNPAARIWFFFEDANFLVNYSLKQNTFEFEPGSFNCPPSSKQAS
jgi:hypothetical protein